MNALRSNGERVQPRCKTVLFDDLFRMFDTKWTALFCFARRLFGIYCASATERQIINEIAAMRMAFVLIWRHTIQSAVWTFVYALWFTLPLPVRKSKITWFGQQRITKVVHSYYKKKQWNWRPESFPIKLTKLYYFK